jgi:hypothetical protein
MNITNEGKLTGLLLINHATTNSIWLKHSMKQTLKQVVHLLKVENMKNQIRSKCTY